MDMKLLRAVSSQEYTQASADIADTGVLQAYRQSLQRHDERLAQAADAETLACKQGCSWCCHFSVDVRPVEVFNILQFVAQQFSPAEQQQLRRDVETNSAVLKPLDELQRMQHNIKCPLLREGRCSIYAARPQTCRNYHATNSAGCQRSYEEPGNLDIEPEYAPLVFQNGAATVDAFSKAMGDAGYDIAAYELNGALAEALRPASNALQRFTAKLPVFSDVDGTDVPLEFIDFED